MKMLTYVQKLIMNLNSERFIRYISETRTEYLNLKSDYQRILSDREDCYA